MSLKAVPDPKALISPAVDRTIEALDCPASDAAVAALARMTAATIDEMPPDQRGLMLGQTAPLLLKVLQELELRAQKRAAKSRSGRPNQVAQLRAAHAVVKAKQGRAS